MLFPHIQLHFSKGEDPFPAKKGSRSGNENSGWLRITSGRLTLPLLPELMPEYVRRFVFYKFE